MRRVAVYAGTRDVYRNMMIAAKSLLANTKMDAVWFLIEDEEFPAELPDVIHTMNVSDQTWFSPSSPNYNTQWSYMSLMRLALPDIFEDEDRILWLDTDTIVEDDIEDLFDLNLSDFYVAMAAEPVRSKYPFVYHNAGVMLMNLDMIRADGMHLKWIRDANTTPYTAPDQDVINIFCQGEILTISPVWNMAGHITQAADYPMIRHYAGSLKWQEPPVFKVYENAEWRVIK